MKTCLPGTLRKTVVPVAALVSPPVAVTGSPQRLTEALRFVAEAAAAGFLFGFAARSKFSAKPRNASGGPISTRNS